MNHNYNSSSPKAIGTPPDRAEVNNYKPPNPRILAKIRALVQQARTWPHGAPEPPMTSDEQRVAFRIARGNGRHVPLYEIQQEREGRGFMSQITPRIHALKHRYGLDIRSHQEGEKSWYYIVFADAVTPSAPVRTTPTQPKPPIPAAASNFLAFETGRTR